MKGTGHNLIFFIEYDESFRVSIIVSIFVRNSLRPFLWIGLFFVAIYKEKCMELGR